jgi:hypothetical protein
VKDSRSAETQAPESSTMSRLSNGFRAHLQGVGLHDLVMLQNLVRASGVFVVLSGERTGTLHFSRGQLLHAETAELNGDAAAIEILSWREGEFINSERTPGEHSSVSASLESLLLRLAKETEEVRPSEPPLTTSTGVRRRMEGAQSLRSTHQGLGVPPAYGGASLAPISPAASTPAASVPGAGPASSAPAAVTLTNVPAASNVPPPSRRLAAAALPGTAVAGPLPPSTPPAPPSVAAPAAPSSTRGEARVAVTNVIVSPRGALVEGNGIDADALGSKVAYIARLTDLIGVTMGAGDTRSIKVRTPTTDLLVRRHADGHVSATLGPADPASDAPPPSSAPASVKLS